MRICPFIMLAVVAITACDNTTPTGGFVGTPPVRIAGTWRYTSSFSDNQLSSCQMTGTANFNQTNDQFTGLLNQGTEVCTYGGQMTEDALYGPISGGEMAVDAVRFTSQGCLHMGTASGSPVNHMVGVTSCSRSIPPETPARMLTGTWEANR